MKVLKKLSVVASIIGVVGLGSFAYAADYTSPVEITSELTGKSVENLQEERQSGKTYGELAKDSGKQKEFKSSMLEHRKSILKERVAEGKITQEKVDEMLHKIEENIKDCDGTGRKDMGKENGIGFGEGKRNGRGNGQGMENKIEKNK